MWHGIYHGHHQSDTVCTVISASVNAGAYAGGVSRLSSNSSQLFRDCLQDLVAYGCVVKLKDNNFQISEEATKFIIICVGTKGRQTCHCTSKACNWRQNNLGNAGGSCWCWLAIEFLQRSSCTTTEIKRSRWCWCHYLVQRSSFGCLCILFWIVVEVHRANRSRTTHFEC